jgi:hypothetical protein
VYDWVMTSWRALLLGLGLAMEGVMETAFLFYRKNKRHVCVLYIYIYLSNPFNVNLHISSSTISLF